MRDTLPKDSKSQQVKVFVYKQTLAWRTAINFKNKVKNSNDESVSKLAETMENVLLDPYVFHDLFRKGSNPVETDQIGPKAIKKVAPPKGTSYQHRGWPSSVDLATLFLITCALTWGERSICRRLRSP